MTLDADRELREKISDLVSDAIEFGHADYNGPVRGETERQEAYQEIDKSVDAIMFFVHSYTARARIDELERLTVHDIHNASNVDVRIAELNQLTEEQ